MHRLYPFYARKIPPFMFELIWVFVDSFLLKKNAVFVWNSVFLFWSWQWKSEEHVHVNLTKYKQIRHFLNCLISIYWNSSLQEEKPSHQPTVSRWSVKHFSEFVRRKLLCLLTTFFSSLLPCRSAPCQLCSRPRLLSSTWCQRGAPLLQMRARFVLFARVCANLSLLLSTLFKTALCP